VLPSQKFAIASRHVVLPDGVRPAAVLIDGRVIADVIDRDRVPSDVPCEDFGDLVIAPGVIDAHVHINEPGRTEWEGFETATRAAAAGGVTMVVDMPLNSSPVTTTLAALKAKQAAAAGKCAVDVGFYGGLVPGNVHQIEPLLDAGVLGIKAFLCHSGLDEFPNATLADLKAAAPILAKHKRPLLVHAELTNGPAPCPAETRRYGEYLATRPPQWESDAIEMLIELCRDTSCHIHIVHLANADALPLIEAAKGEGLPLTVETCPHYLCFAAEEIPDGATQYKCAPPIREGRHRELLWEALKRGVIDTIGSDHSPCPPEMKHLESGNFMEAWGGIASLQLTLPIVWTEASRRGIGLEQVFRWLSTNPARLIGLESMKGKIAPGYCSDLIVWNPETRWHVRAGELQHRHKLTPYDGVELLGAVERTYASEKPLAVFFGGPTPQKLAKLISDGDCDATRSNLLKCCASSRWVGVILAARPFADDAALLEAAARYWWELDRDDWLEAFAAHPKIGDIDSLRAKFANTRQWAGGEQAGVAEASEVVLQRLAKLNDEYEKKFGYIFIVCATGRSADEMLAILESRLPNDADTEIKIAAGEQLKITELRLQKLTIARS
jgi:allantoinase